MPNSIKDVLLIALSGIGGVLVVPVIILLLDALVSASRAGR